jgi:bifunctional DNA-binding transcriptional regulator/antitoxin component of YhaV-PrlF toxin-antitoxin module
MRIGRILKMNNYLKELEIKENDNGDLYFTLPDDVLNRLDWKEGDDLKFIEQDEGFMIKKVRYENIELELDDEDLFQLMQDAHKNNVSFNDYVEQILQEFINENKNDA